jgi:hypothetical protein
LAQITAGFGSAFSTQLNLPPELWLEMGDRDRNNPVLVGADGKRHSYDELLATAGPAVAAAITPEEIARRHKQCQHDIAEIGRRLAQAEVDAVVAIADDERFLFQEDNFPAWLVCWGESNPYAPRPVPADANPIAKGSAWAYGSEKVDFKGAPELGEHVIRELAGAGFDVSRRSRRVRASGIPTASPTRASSAANRWQRHGCR